MRIVSESSMTRIFFFLLIKSPRLRLQDDERSARERWPQRGRRHALGSQRETRGNHENQSDFATQGAQHQSARVDREVGGGLRQRFGVAELIGEVDIVVVQGEL